MTGDDAMSELSNAEPTIITEYMLGGNRDMIDKLRKLSVQTGSLACLGCADHDAMCTVSGCAIMRKAAIALIDADTLIGKLETMLVAKEQRVRRLEYEANEALRVATTSSLFECSDYCAHAHAWSSEDCDEMVYECTESCKSYGKCVCKDCSSGSKFEWKELTQK